MATSPVIPIGLADERAGRDGQAAPRIRIGSLLLDPDTLELTDGDRVEVLRPLPAALLFHLLRQRHRIVSKEELHRVLWPDTSVSDAALASAIRDLRRLLADDGEAQEMVRTFRGRGYRLVAPVEIDPHPDGAVALEGPRAAVPPTDLPFVGRERELSRFDRIRLSAEGGRGATMLVESVGGGGRTAFLEACARRTTGVLWLGIACTNEPWAPRFDAITRLLLELESAVGSDLVEEWVKADPEIAFLLPDFLPRPGASAPGIEALSAALRRLLERANRLAPVVIAVDDVHFIDRSSLDLLCTGAARTTMLVGTLDPARVAGLARGGIDALFSERGRVRLGGLTAADVSLLAEALPTSTRDARWAARLRERTAGHPADVVAVIEEMARAGADSPCTTPLLPRAVFERIERRMAGLSRPARALVTAAAALPPGAAPPLVERLADIGAAPGAGREALAECVLAGLLCSRSHPAGIEPCGQLVRHVALALLSPDRRRALERRATEVLRESA
jgi:DNA-binding winged helix-turn-helix (wHTH) protein